MNNKLEQYQDFREVKLAYDIAVHALTEYRLWRDNNYVGQELGLVRNAYLAILRQRVRYAIYAYKLVQILHQAEPAASHYQRAA